LERDLRRPATVEFDHLGEGDARRCASLPGHFNRHALGAPVVVVGVDHEVAELILDFLFWGQFLGGGGGLVVGPLLGDRADSGDRDRGDQQHRHKHKRDYGPHRAAPEWIACCHGSIRCRVQTEESEDYDDGAFDYSETGKGWDVPTVSTTGTDSTL